MTKKATQLIGEVRGGLPAKKADQLIEDAIKAARMSGKPATVTITLKFEPHGDRNRMIDVSVISAAKLPVDPALLESSIYYLTDRGEMTRDDPLEQRGLTGVLNREDGLADGGAPSDERRFGAAN